MIHLLNHRTRLLMNLRLLAMVSLAWLPAVPTLADDIDSVGETVVLFDGDSLDGWVGNEKLWTVEDGQIVGRTNDSDPIEKNTFLVYSGKEFGNFELTLRFKIESGNSGVQYRSTLVDEDKFVVQGYQADIDFANTFAGILYEEGRRGILAKRGERVTIDDDGEKLTKRMGDAQALGNGIHPGQWNDFRIVAKGNHLQHYINETLTAEVIDGQTDTAAKSGVIALQLHRGPAMTVRFKDISLRPIQ
ncbi:DUF1080 domain-containing protein [Rubripirellula amarantea]|nr:DUF1080 domain-containing protein [Rubripirellula amarantea]